MEDNDTTIFHIFRTILKPCSILSVHFFVVPVNSHLAGVGFPEFLAGDDLEEAEQLATVRQVREQVVHLEMSRRMRRMMMMRMMRMMIMG